MRGPTEQLNENMDRPDIRFEPGFSLQAFGKVCKRTWSQQGPNAQSERVELRHGAVSWLPDGYIQIFRLYLFGFGLEGLWLRYTTLQNFLGVILKLPDTPHMTPGRIIGLFLKFLYYDLSDRNCIMGLIQGQGDSIWH